MITIKRVSKAIKQAEQPITPGIKPVEKPKKTTKRKEAK